VGARPRSLVRRSLARAPRRGAGRIGALDPARRRARFRRAVRVDRRRRSGVRRGDGAWRDPRLALYVAIKLPALLVPTPLVAALVDALVNGLWARSFGFELTLAQSLRAVLLAFALASIVLGGAAPVAAFFAMTLPASTSASARFAHDLLGVAHVATTAVAGTIA